MLEGKEEIGELVKVEKSKRGNEDMGGKLYRAELKVLHLASSGLLAHQREGIKQDSLAALGLFVRVFWIVS
jgi:hypothetical protein